MSETWGAPSKHEVWQVESIKPCLKISKWNGHQGGQEWHYPRASTENPIFFSSPINSVGLRPPAPLRWSPKSHISLVNSQPSFYNQTIFCSEASLYLKKTEFNLHSEEDFCSKGRAAWLSNQKAQVKHKVDWFLHLCSEGASCNSAWPSPWLGGDGEEGEGRRERWSF